MSELVFRLSGSMLRKIDSIFSISLTKLDCGSRKAFEHEFPEVDRTWLDDDVCCRFNGCNGCWKSVDFEVGRIWLL